MQKIKDQALGQDTHPELQQRLDQLLDMMNYESDKFLGYPCTRDFDYSPLFPFLFYPVNNVGDPYVESTFRLNTHDIECEVLDLFMDFTHATKEKHWGYITNGGTEGNMYGIYLAREILPQGMVYFSEDTHYSVSKILRLLHARNIMIKSLPNGEIDYQDLKETVRIHRDVPPIIFANIGTTMKGAVDNVLKIKEIMEEMAISSYYIHADAALSGMVLPFVDQPQPFDFSSGVDSISISGHKMIGSPIPCGVVLAKKSNVDRVARSVEYIGTLDTTLSGSRNAITPLFLWYAIKSQGRDGFRKIIQRCIDMADYAIEQFEAADINAWRNRNSLTVVFPRPSDYVLKKWQIAVHHEVAHIITMPHVEKRQIHSLIKDIKEFG
ncbi:MAG: histidine decarboxylase [Gammaproteobacteria bacterium]|nr:histidine decarboxylase [Gammaproteobacteria bacterium]